MVSSKAPTPEAYIAELPPEHAALVSRLRDLVNANLPDGYVERMSWGMISWEVPLERYPETYNGQPLVYAGLAAQKNYYALYLNCAYQDPAKEQRLRDAFARAGKKLDMGKSCLRFKKLDDLPLDVIGRTIAATTPEELIRRYEESRRK